MDSGFKCIMFGKGTFLQIRPNSYRVAVLVQKRKMNKTTTCCFFSNSCGGMTITGSSLLAWPVGNI